VNTYFIEIYFKTAHLQLLPEISTILIAGIIANYGLIGIHLNAGIGYLLFYGAILIENACGVLLEKTNSKLSDRHISLFIAFLFGISLSSGIGTIVQLSMSKSIEYFNVWVYPSIIVTSIYIVGYFFVVRLYGILYDSIACTMSIIYTLLFTLLMSTVNNTFIAIIGSVLLFINSLDYTVRKSRRDIIYVERS